MVLEVSATKNPGRCESTFRKRTAPSSRSSSFSRPSLIDRRQHFTGVFIVDISDRRQRTAGRRRTPPVPGIFETGSAAMLITTPGGVILAANPAACPLFGRKGDELRSGPGEGLGGAGDPRFVELSRMCAEAGSAEGELRLIRGDDAPFDVMVEAARFLDQDGSPAMNMILRDITGQKKAGRAPARIRRQPRQFSTACQIPSAGPIPAAHASFSTRHGLHLPGRLLPMNRETAGWSASTLMTAIITGKHSETPEVSGADLKRSTVFGIIPVNTGGSARSVYLTPCPMMKKPA